MTHHLEPRATGRAERLFASLVRHPGRVLFAIVLATAALIPAGIVSASGEDASFDPGGEEFDTAVQVARTFRAATTELLFIVEDENADALDRATLQEWKLNSDTLRSDPELRPAFSTYFNSRLDLTVTGFYTIADAVHDELVASGISDGLESASDDDVKVALDRVLDESRSTAIFRDVLSVHATAEATTVAGQAITRWESPAFIAQVRVDHAAFPVDLEGSSDPETRSDSEQAAIDATRDVEIEHWGRDALSTLRGDRETFDAWGVGIDNALTSDESFLATMPFLLGAIVLIVLLVGGLLRSYWAATLAGAGVALTLLWSRMLTNLVGFDSSIILNVIVPVATISFGVDFLIHTVGRIREELADGRQHRAAYAVGIASVVGALGLALSTSAVAFASNATSNIQGVTEFGFGAAIALAVAFLVLGILAPLFLLRIEEIVSATPATGASIVGRVLGWFRLLLVAALAGVVVVATIIVPFVGTVLVVLYGALAIGVPVWWLRRRARREGITSTAVSGSNTAGESLTLAGTVVAAVVRMRYAMLVGVGVVTAAAVLAATDVGRKTEPQDFFPSNSDFITGIERIVEHTSSASPGDVYIYIEGDLADPVILEAMEAAKARVGAEGGDLFARNPDGSLAASESALELARAATALEFARTAIAEATGVTLTDDDGNGLPDTYAQVQAAFDYAAEDGIPFDATTFAYTADDVRRVLQPVDRGEFATVLRFPMQGFPETSKVEEARLLVRSAADDLAATAGQAGLDLGARVSGEVVAEQVALDAITDAMVVSVPLAMVLCLAMAAIAMRSIRLAAASVVPIALVIVWLLAFMAVFDYDINVVTATITAISVGVGIDFSTHFTMRYREQLSSAPSRLDAVRSAASSTGTALLLSGSTSIVGFGLLALAPMPIFAAYGLLTAVMIALSLAAALIVLPSLLFFITSEPAGGSI